MPTTRPFLAFVEARRLGVVMVESGFLLSRDPDTVRGPDVSFVLRSRANTVVRRGFVPGAPDFAVEIRSPDNTMLASASSSRIRGSSSHQYSSTLANSSTSE